MIEKIIHVFHFGQAPDDSIYWNRMSDETKNVLLQQIEHRLYQFESGKLEPDIKKMIDLLNQHKIEYLLVGGYAVVYHGHRRKMGDFDVWINPNSGLKLLDVLGQFGIAITTVTAEAVVAPNTVVQIGFPPNRIDILCNIVGLDFDACYSTKVIATFSGLQVSIIGLSELKKMKKLAAREKDIKDLKFFDFNFAMDQDDIGRRKK